MSEKMRISANGNIGIGNSNPTATLEVTNNVGKDTLCIHAIIRSARVTVITSGNVHRCGGGSCTPIPIGYGYKVQACR